MKDLCTQLFKKFTVPLKNRNPILINNSFYMYTDNMDSLNLIKNRTYEPKITKLLNNSLKKDSIMLDIGANIGYYTLLSGQICKKVYAFEPEKDNYRILEKNIHLNSINGKIPENKIIAENLALSDKMQELELEIQPFNKGGHSIVKNGRNTKWHKQIVQATTLDEYFNNKDCPDYIKIDVEGYEAQVINGGRNVFRNAKLIVFEDNSSLAYNLIKDLGFKLYRIDSNHNYYAIKK